MISFKILYLFHLLVSVGAYLVPSWSVQLPLTLNALEDSCVFIPCKFNISDFESELNKSGSVHGVWIKTDHPYSKNPVVFNGTSGNTLLFERIEIVGNLSSRDCSTVFYNVNTTHRDKYFFRIEMTHNRGTFTETYVDLNVQAALASPQVLALSDSEVAEGSSVNLTCTAAAPCPDQPPNITWSLHSGDISTHIQDEKDGTKILVSFLTFTASRSHHGREIFCMASYLRHNRSAWEANSTVQTLSVLFSPEVVEASVSPSGAVAEGSSVALTCNSSEANPPVHNYTWFRDTQTSPVGSGPNITFNVSSSHAGLYYCRAEHPQGGKESNKVKLRVEGSSLIYVMAAGGCLGVLLLCVVTGFVLRIKKSKVTEQDNQNPIPQDSDVHDKGGPAHTNAPNPIKDKQEEIHYGEISFSRPPLRDRSEGTGQQGLGQAPESEYAEVLLPGGAGQARYRKAPDTQDLYAQVKCK